MTASELKEINLQKSDILPKKEIILKEIHLISNINHKEELIYDVDDYYIDDNLYQSLDYEMDSIFNQTRIRIFAVSKCGKIKNKIAILINYSIIDIKRIEIIE